MDNKELVDALKSFYDELKTDNLDDMDDMYHDEVSFTDPIHQVVGLDDLKEYFKGTMENVEYCHFTFDDECVSEDKAYLSWQMRYSHPKIGHRVSAYRRTPLPTTIVCRKASVN